MLQLFVNGPPGAGKTSLCKLLCAEFQLELVATGDLLRENILQRTELGRLAKECISNKTLVPDHVVIDMIAEKILACRLRQQGWVLDGFPRTVEQVAALRRKLIVPSVVIVMDLGEAECIKRLTGRRFDPITSQIYYMPLRMPRDATVLSRLTKRSDDAAEKLPPRMEAYRQYGEKINAEYREIVHRVNASARPESLLDLVVTLLHELRPNAQAQVTSVPSMGAAHTIRGNQQPASSKLAASKRAMPQRIEEEDEEEDEQLHSFAYDQDDDVVLPQVPTVRSPTADGTVSTPPVQQPPRKVSLTSLPSVPQVNQDVAALPQRIDLQFQTLHADLGRHMESTSTFAPTMGVTKAPSQPEASSPVHSNNDRQVPSPSLAPVAACANQALPSSSVPIPLPPPPAAPSTEDAEFVRFRDLLLDGFEVLKHGRRGSPHMRVLFTDVELKRLFWIKPTKEPKAKKAKLDQSLLLADVVQVVRGMKTEVLKRSGDVTKYERYLSLVADDRTLDMELPSETMCAFLMKGFEQLIHNTT